MACPMITTTEKKGFRVVKFEIPGGVCSPQEAGDAVKGVEKELPSDKPTLLKGRGPVWLYAMLVHAAHPTPMVATYDPRLGYVVVATHDEKYAVGQVIEDPEKAA